MFKGFVSGKVKYNPKFKTIKGELCCDFILETFDHNDGDSKSLVRCSCFNDEAKKMKNISKGEILIGLGDASNIAYTQGRYVYNLRLNYIEFVKGNYNLELLK